MSQIPNDPVISAAAYEQSVKLAQEANLNKRQVIRNLGKDDFLKLFMAQLIHQNPMEPLNNEQFVAQMAQFTAIEQATNTASTVAQMLGAQQETNEILSMMLYSQVGSTSKLMYESSSLIGRTVLAQSEGQSPVQSRVVRVVLNNGQVEVQLANGSFFYVHEILEIAE